MTTQFDAEAGKRLALLEEWMAAYSSDVLNLAYSYVKQYHVAEEITQDVFLRAFTHIESFRGSSSVKTWLLSIAANRCKDHLRSWSVRHETNSDALTEREPSGGDVAAEVESRLQRTALWRAVGNLPQKYSEVLILYYQRDLSATEVAQVLHISEATVRTRLHRGRSALRQMFGDGGEPDDV